MLQYLYQARDDNEHGLEDVAEQVPGSLSIGSSKPGYSRSVVIEGDSTSGFRFLTPDGKRARIERVKPHIGLRTVHGRGNNAYPPPTMHQGKPVPKPLPLPVARLALVYLSVLIAEAKVLS